jgi:hypothetical protein
MGDRGFESVSLQRRVCLSPEFAFAGREPRFSARVCAACMATGSAETCRAYRYRAKWRQYLCLAIFQYRPNAIHWRNPEHRELFLSGPAKPAATFGVRELGYVGVPRAFGRSSQSVRGVLRSRSRFLCHCDTFSSLSPMLAKDSSISLSVFSPQFGTKRRSTAP